MKVITGPIHTDISCHLISIGPSLMFDLTNLGIQCPTASTASTAVAAISRTTTNNKSAQQSRSWLYSKVLIGTRSVGFLMSF